MTTPVVEILRGAKVELARRGWQQGGYFADRPGEDEDGGEIPPGGSCCLLGACIASAGTWEAMNNWLDYLDRAASETPNRVRHALGFNDLSSTTIDDVQALLDRAIALAEAA